MSRLSYSRRQQAVMLAPLMASLAISEQAMAASDSVPPAMLAFAGLLYTAAEFAGAVGMQNATSLGGISPWPSAVLSVLVLLMGSAAVVHMFVWLGQQQSSRHASDTPSLILIVIICCLCLLASVWAAFYGPDLSAYLL